MLLIYSSRYNLKRRVASLPPLSSEVFTEKVLTAQASSSAAAAKASFEKTCSACQKVYYSENAYQNHLGSQKHRLRIAVLKNSGRSGRDVETTSLTSSTFSLGEPIRLVPTESIDAEAEAEFSKVVSGIKETAINDSEPVSRRPSRPHHSANQDLPQNTTEPPISTGAEILLKGSAARNPLQSLPLNRCMFCNYDSPSLKLNVMHMGKFHGMFIPEQPYLIDLDGLINYLHEKVANSFECLYCHKLKNSISGIQTHMRDKGHCMIAFDSEDEMVEVGQFYDFTSTYSDDEDDEDDKDIVEVEDTVNKISGGVTLGSRRSDALKVIICSPEGDQLMREGEENAEGWETDSSASSLDSEDLTAVPIDHSHAFDRLTLHRHHSNTDPRPHRTADGFHSHAHSHYAVFRSDYELHLPSGRTAGHRALSRYYRQNLHHHSTAAGRNGSRLISHTLEPKSDDDTTLDRETRGRQALTRANGGAGMLGVTDAKKREVRAVEKRERRREQRIQQQHQWGVDKRGNSQKHFRDPLLQ